MHLPIITRLSGRYIFRSVLQSVLFIIGVALGVAMVVAIDLANNSASRAFELSAQSIAGKATHQIVSANGELPSALYRELRSDLGLEASAPVIEHLVRSPQLGDRPLRLFGVDPFAEPPFRNYLTNIEVSGESQSPFEALTSFLAVPNTALISARTAERYGIQPGDTITVQPGGEPAQLQIVGVLVLDGLGAAALDDLILTDIATAQEVAGQPGMINRIDLILPPDFDTNRITALLPEGAILTTPSARSDVLSQLTDAFELNLQALSLLALVVGVFLIYNTVSFSVIRRRAVFSILRSVGATRSQILRLVLGEALVLSAVGVIIGLGLGIIFGRFAVGVIAQTITDLYFTVNVQGVTLDVATLIKAAVIGLLASIAAAFIPAISATNTPPAGSLRRSLFEEGARRLLPLVTIGGIAMVILGVLLLQIPTSDLAISFGGLFCIVVGGALFTPVALDVMMRLAPAVLARIAGVLGKMAPRAVSRSLSRTSVAVAALTVAVSVIVGVSVMISSFRNTVTEWLTITLGADIYISPPQVMAVRSQGNIDPELADLVAAVPGVASVVSGRNVTTQAPDYPNLPDVNLLIASGELTGGQRPFVWLADGLTSENYWDALQTGDVIMVSEPFAFRRKITPENNVLRLITDDGEITFTVLGVFYDYASDQGSVFMADAVYRSHFDDPYITTMGVFINDDADYATVLDGIRAALAGTDLTAQSNRDLRNAAINVFERTFAITQALRLLAVIVAFIGILSALLSLQIEQTRQYGIMRAVGLTPGQLWKFTLLQTGLMGFAAGLMALPIGLALAIVLIYVINVRSFGWTMQLSLSPEEFLLAFVVAVIAAILAGLYPARRISKLVTAEALRGE